MYVYFPAVKGKQGDFEFYSIQVSFDALAKSFVFDDSSLPIEVRSQRELNIVRARKFHKYIEDNPKDFVTGSVIGTVDESAVFIPIESPFVDNVGALRIPADFTITLADGQHRQKGIDLLEQAGGIGHQSLPVILYQAFSPKRRQQIFTDVNSNSVKPSTSLSMTFDHRSNFVNWVKEVTRSVPGLVGCVEFEANSVGAKSLRLWPLISFKSFICNLTGLTESIFDQQIIDDNSRKMLSSIVKQFLEGLNHLPLWKDMLTKKVNPAELRADYIVSHAVFLEALGLWGRQLLEHFDETKEQRWDLMERLSQVSIQKDAYIGRCVTPQRTIQKNHFGIRSTASLICKVTGIPASPAMEDTEKVLAQSAS